MKEATRCHLPPPEDASTVGQDGADMQRHKHTVYQCLCRTTHTHTEGRKLPPPTHTLYSRGC